MWMYVFYVIAAIIAISALKTVISFIARIAFVGVFVIAVLLFFNQIAVDSLGLYTKQAGSYATQFVNQGKEQSWFIELNNKWFQLQEKLHLR